MLPRIAFLLSFVCLIFSCDKEKPTGASLFKSIPASHSNINFINSVKNSEDLNIFTYRNFYNGGGVGIGDFNNDGLQDVYLTANMSSNKLFINKGNFEFEDVTPHAGVGLENKWSTGVSILDINHDGWLDIYVCNAGYLKGQTPHNSLFINNGDLTFTEKANDFGLNDNGYSTHAVFFDYDRDNDLDCYIVNNSFIPTNTLNYSNKRDLRYDDWPVRDFLKGGGDKILENRDGKFIDVSEKAGIYQSLIGFGLGLSVGDINNDDYPDIYVSNDFFEKDYLYINQKDGTFKEALEDYFTHISHSSMGSDMRDINNDARPDLFVTDMLPYDHYRLKTNASFDDINLRNVKVKKGFYNQFMHNTLQLNTRHGFKDIAFQSGVAATDWSWGALIFDADNDELNDLFVCNGIYHSVIDLDFMDFFANDLLQKMALTGTKTQLDSIINIMPSEPISNKFYKNVNGIQFSDKTTESGLDRKSFSNGAAYADLDNDGDLDLIVNNVNQPLDLFENTTKHPGVLIELAYKAANLNAFGAKIFLHTDSTRLFQELQPARGFQSSVDLRAHFGVSASNIDSILITWPGGERTRHIAFADSQLIHIEFDIKELTNNSSLLANTSRLEWNELKQDLGKHIEDQHVDFFFERGIYKMLSKEGPEVVTADVNKDGLDDILISGARFQASRLYLQDKAGEFSLSNQPDLEKHLKFEDVCAQFFDFEGDGDLDLVIGTGGNFDIPNNPLLRDRAYINENGVFRAHKGFKAAVGMNTSSIISWDWDKDNDLDLFIFSKSVPQHYGYRPPHFYYENDGKGNFTDMSTKVLKGFKWLGMVSDAKLVEDRIVVCGEWMKPFEIIASNNNLSYQEISNAPSGWFTHINAADINKDGKADLLFGNNGLNNYVNAFGGTEYSLWIKDFDNNGTPDKILCSVDPGGNHVPIPLKKELAMQITAIKKNKIKHSAYADKHMETLFSKAQRKDAGIRTASELRSFLLMSNTEGKYDLTYLPDQSQLSCIHASSIEDVDGDGDLDILYGGNDYSWLPQYSRLDAFRIEYLENTGNGSFQHATNRLNISPDGALRSMAKLKVKDTDAYVFGFNNANVRLFQKPNQK